MAVTPTPEQTPLRAGRSRASVLVLARRSLHVFVWSPWTGANSTGCCVRHRRGDVWTHWRLIVFQRNAQNGSRLRHMSPKRAARGDRIRLRPTLTVFEVSRWQTRDGTGERQRFGTKGYVRLKISLPGSEAGNALS
jgi:hypothetical protein